MKGDRAALPLVRHLDLQAEHIAKLALERCQIRVDRPPVSRAPPSDVSSSTRTSSFRERFRLTNRKALADNFPGQLFWIFRRRNCAGMTHTDIALQ